MRDQEITAEIESEAPVVPLLSRPDRRQDGVRAELEALHARLDRIETTLQTQEDSR